MVEQKITAIMIVEVVGRPAEYLESALKSHLEKLKNIKDVKLISLKISEPKSIEEEKDLYTCFGEVEVETIGIAKLMDLIFDFMPSSVEIIEPTRIELNCQEATMFCNDLAGRLHKYDEVAKIANMKIQELSQQLQQQKAIDSNRGQSPIQPIQITMNSPEKEKPKPKSKKKKK